MTKADIVARVMGRLDCTKAEAISMVEDAFELVKDAIASERELKISGFGTFTVKEKSSRRGRNPQTGEDIVISGRRVLTFKASPILRARVNK